MESETDRRIGAVAAVMRSLYRSVVVKRKLSRKAKLSIYWSIYILTFTYGHELWVMTERIRSRIQAAVMSFLCHPGGARSRAAATPHREEPTEVARASVSDAPWECLGILPEELEEVSVEREVWVSLLKQLPPRPGPG